MKISVAESDVVKCWCWGCSEGKEESSGETAGKRGLSGWEQG